MTARLLRLTLSAAVVGLFATACHRKQPKPETAADSQLRARLVGTWTMGWQQSTGFTAKGVLVLGSDGTSACRITNRWQTGQREFAYQAAWQVKTGVLVFTYTKSSEPQLPIGTVEPLRIFHLNDTSFEAVDEALHQTNTFTRQN